MRPILITPMHDPGGLIFPHLEAITAQLKDVFARVYLSIPPSTRVAQAEYVDHLEADTFFRVLSPPRDLSVGEHFRYLYQQSISTWSPEQALHLCFLDRVAFALHSQYRESFIADMRAIEDACLPLLFQRSEAAWDTHPRSYREIEGMATRAGEWLFGRRLDFAWCHLVVQAQQLGQMLAYARNDDMSIMAEMVLCFRDSIQTRDVDWLAWEDPFLYGRDAVQFKREREASLEETRKRLGYVLPMMERLLVWEGDQGSGNQAISYLSVNPSYIRK
jgi:hypothetical protein